MRKRFINWLQHLLDPHCAVCEEAKQCRSCAELHEMLISERLEKRHLVDTIARLIEPRVDAVEVRPEIMRPNKTTWREKRRLLEQEDRKKAELMRALDSQIELNPPVINKSTEELEEELGVNNV